MYNNEQAVFQEKYLKNFWGSSESASGPGSTLAITTLLRQNLKDALKTLGLKSFVDAPCGDLNWMRHLDYDFELYIGVDIVPELISKLRADPLLKGRNFQSNNIVTDILPSADAIFCRDCLVHLPFELINQVIKRWQLAGFKYVMVTTFPEHVENTDCEIGSWRTLNFCAPPFNWPNPILLVSEFDTEMEWEHRDKSIGVWRLDSIPGAKN